MSKPLNEDPFMPWNDPAYANDPFAPHNDPMYSDDPSSPWNDPFATLDDLSNEELVAYGRRPRQNEELEDREDGDYGIDGF